MTSFTRVALASRIRTVGDYASSLVFSATFLNDQINVAIGDYCDLLDEEFEGYRDKTGTVATVAGTATVALPSDFLKARAVDVLDSGRYRPLHLFAIAQTYGWDQQEIPRGYMHVGANLELFPTPNAVYTIRLRYVPTAPVLDDDSDTIDIPNGWEDWIIHAVLAVLDEREERDFGSRLAVCDRIRARVAKAAKTRNVAGPCYVPFPGEGEDFFP